MLYEYSFIHHPYPSSIHPSVCLSIDPSIASIAHVIHYAHACMTAYHLVQKGGLSGIPQLALRKYNSARIISGDWTWQSCAHPLPPHVLSPSLFLFFTSMLLAFPTTTELLIPNTYTTANIVPNDLVSQHVNNLLQANQHVTEACVAPTSFPFACHSCLPLQCPSSNNNNTNNNSMH